MSANRTFVNLLLTTLSNTVLSYLTRTHVHFSPVNQHSLPVLRYGDPLHAHSKTSRSARARLRPELAEGSKAAPYSDAGACPERSGVEGWKSHETGPEGQKQGRKDFTKVPCLPKLDHLSLSFGQGPKGRHFKKTFSAPPPSEDPGAVGACREPRRRMGIPQQCRKCRYF